MPEIFEVTSVNPKFVMQDHSYGKGFVKILHLVRNGIVLNLGDFSKDFKQFSYFSRSRAQHQGV